MTRVWWFWTLPRIWLMIIIDEAELFHWKFFLSSCRLHILNVVICEQIKIPNLEFTWHYCIKSQHLNFFNRLQTANWLHKTRIKKEKYWYTLAYAFCRKKDEKHLRTSLRSIHSAEKSSWERVFGSQMHEWSHTAAPLMSSQVTTSSKYLPLAAHSS